VLKQKVSYDIVRRLHDLEDNSSLAQQRGILCRDAVLCTNEIAPCMIILSHCSLPTWHAFVQRAYFDTSSGDFKSVFKFLSAYQFKLHFVTHAKCSCLSGSLSIMEL